MSNINARLVMAAVAGLALPILTRDEDRRYAVWPPKNEPDNRGRRAEKDEIALAKAAAKRQRKAAKRLALKVGAGDTPTERPNVLADRPAALHAAGPATEGSEVERRVSAHLCEERK